MGIKYFFAWIKKNFDKNIYPLKDGEIFSDKFGNEEKITIDNLMLDMNGIFHNSAQKIFEYGNFKKADSVLLEKKKITIEERTLKQKLIYKDICKTIKNLFNTIIPNKRLIICIDGPAPLAKQNQQRQRRFRAAKENNNSDFDSNSISPGTKFMDFLSKYIDYYIRKKISTNEKWKNIEVIFSSEKVPGEGEHKLLNYYRYYGDKSESYCVYANDADLIMLTLGTHNDKFFVLRDCMYDENYKYYILNTPEISKDIIQSMKFDSEKFNNKTAINDFIFISFLVGNDFLPNIPSLEIMQNGIEIMFDVYKKVGESFGHLTEYNKTKGIIFNKNNMAIFLGTIGQYEEGILTGKYRKKDMFFEDKLLDKNIRLINGKYCLNLKEYKKDYNIHKLQIAETTENTNEENMQTITHKYLEGMQWVLSYYTRGTPAWRWIYPYNYAPFASDMVEYIKNFNGVTYKVEKPIIPFLQLLTILPPKSAHLLPKPLSKLLYDTNSPIAKFCPKNFLIDYSGKKRAWEGLVILPILNYNEFIKVYSEKIMDVNNKELKRNIIGKSYIYNYSSEIYYFSSFNGDISQCHAQTRVIDI